MSSNIFRSPTDRDFKLALENICQCVMETPRSSDHLQPQSLTKENLELLEVQSALEKWRDSSRRLREVYNLALEFVNAAESGALATSTNLPSDDGENRLASNSACDCQECRQAIGIYDNDEVSTDPATYEIPEEAMSRLSLSRK
ncbi:hypothetical protein SCHPADRAFT_940289 [Schizopora paradoxa]|uniref:Uncharacterized protein n=1 Tax=Schizopora paradoxa TaxID=27342 RepID=A0A0H2RVQ4_9AGAM|nr:hypothetical protein SCHPADRAFT_940289 [Schizopora paradoxa]